jgi:hypothetical protein
MAVTLQHDAQKNLGILRWERNPLGRKPISYRVYASDEKGFSASDTTFEAAGGLYDFQRQEATKAPTLFPSNFLAETKETELAVLGPGVKATAANKAFYRVVAVDEHGNRSGPSDYIAAPRPVIIRRPVETATVGVQYRDQVKIIRSIGDLRTRVIAGREVMNYWDVEQPQFEIEQGPKWLTIDRDTGHLSGTPEAVGQVKIVVAVKLHCAERTLDPGQLQWGVEKMVRAEVRIVGTARQSFVIKTNAPSN